MSDFPPKLTAQQMAGIFKDDLSWDEFQAVVAGYRQELDAELAAESRQMDEADRRWSN